MSAETSFRLPRLLLPRAGTDLKKWAVIACDQYTSEPEYWQRIADEVGNAPSTLRLILPEVHLTSADVTERIAAIQGAMRRYVAEGLLQEHQGAIYVERTIGNRVRRGLMLELDLEEYNFGRDSASLIRPTEGTIVERIAPRIAVRRGAELELPHILVLIDDPEGTVIEPIAAERQSLQPLYDTDLMAGSGHLSGFAVDPERGARAAKALAALADPASFAPRYGVPAGTPPMLFPVGDGNHSLATAKAYWDSIKASVGLDHPARYALVEIENIHDPALEFEPIHRVLFGVTKDFRQALAAAFGASFSCTDVPSAEAMRERVHKGREGCHVVGLIGPGERFSVVEVSDPPSTLPVGTIQPFIDRFIEQGGAASIDYVHGDEALDKLSVSEGNVGVYLPGLDKGDLLRMVVREGPLPRKTFSMGEAHEKRFYMEARRIR